MASFRKGWRWLQAWISYSIWKATDLIVPCSVQTHLICTFLVMMTVRSIFHTCLRVSSITDVMPWSFYESFAPVMIPKLVLSLASSGSVVLNLWSAAQCWATRPQTLGQAGTGSWSTAAFSQARLPTSPARGGCSLEKKLFRWVTGRRTSQPNPGRLAGLMWLCSGCGTLPLGHQRHPCPTPSLWKIFSTGSIHGPRRLRTNALVQGCPYAAHDKKSPSGPWASIVMLHICL